MKLLFNPFNHSLRLKKPTSFKKIQVSAKQMQRSRQRNTINLRVQQAPGFIIISTYVEVMSGKDGVFRQNRVAMVTLGKDSVLTIGKMRPNRIS